MVTCDHAERNQNHASRELSKFAAVRLGLLQSNGALAVTLSRPQGADGASCEERTLAPGSSNAAFKRKLAQRIYPLRRRCSRKCSCIGVTETTSYWDIVLGSLRQPRLEIVKKSFPHRVVTAWNWPKCRILEILTSDT